MTSLEVVWTAWVMSWPCAVATTVVAWAWTVLAFCSATRGAETQTPNPARAAMSAVAEPRRSQSFIRRQAPETSAGTATRRSAR